MATKNWVNPKVTLWLFRKEKLIGRWEKTRSVPGTGVARDREADLVSNTWRRRSKYTIHQHRFYTTLSTPSSSLTTPKFTSRVTLR